MMAASRATWRRAFDAADRAVTPRLESLVRTERSARVIALTTRARAVVRSQVEGFSARLWHGLNLPASSDVTRLRAQLGALDREVRRLGIRLDQQPAAPAEESNRSEENADAEATHAADRP